MKRLGILFIAVVAFYSCKKKDADKTEYTISGVLYDFDGETPVAGKIIELWVESDRGRFQHEDDINFRTTTSTDGNGAFEFKYKELRSDENKLTIAPPASETPVTGVILKNIPANENVQRDLCLGSNIKVKIVLDIELTPTDSLFIYRPSKSDTIYTSDKDEIIYQSTWDKDYEHMEVYSEVIYWGVGKQQLNEKIDSYLSGDRSENTLRHQVYEGISGCPEVVELVVK